MATHYKFEVFIEDLEETVEFETVPIVFDSQKLEVTNGNYYTQYFTSNYALIEDEKQNLITVFRVAEIEPGKSRRCIFADGSVLTIRRLLNNTFQSTFVNKDGANLTSAISNWQHEFTLDSVKYWYIELGGPTYGIPYTSPKYEIISPYSSTLDNGAIAITYAQNFKPTMQRHAYNADIGNKPNGGIPDTIRYANAILGDFLLKAQQKDPSFWTTTSKKQGGVGSFVYSTEDVAIPSVSSVSALSTGFINMYKMSVSSINTLSGYLWDDNFISTLKKYFVSPSEAIISLAMSPFELTNVNPETSRVFIGNASTPASGNQIVNQYTSLDFGTIDFLEYWGNYIDYELTDVSVYLPYCGSYKLDAKDVVKSKIHLVYNMDLLSGECVALLHIEKDYGLKSVLYQYNGNILSHIPYSASDMSSYVNTVLSTVSTGISGGLIGTGGAIASVAVSSAFGAKKESVIKGGSASGGKGFLSPQRPYLIITRPDQSLPENFNSFVGYPSNITKKLSSCKGYTEVEHIHLENITATEVEISEIESLLKSGVLIN